MSSLSNECFISLEYDGFTYIHSLRIEGILVKSNERNDFNASTISTYFWHIVDKHVVTLPKKIMWSHLIQNVAELHKSDRKHVCQLLIMLLYRNWLLTFHLLTIKMVHNVLVLHKRQKCITWHTFSDSSPLCSLFIEGNRKIIWRTVNDYKIRLEDQ